MASQFLEHWFVKVYWLDSSISEPAPIFTDFTKFRAYLKKTANLKLLYSSLQPVIARKGAALRNIGGGELVPTPRDSGALPLKTGGYVPVTNILWGCPLDCWLGFPLKSAYHYIQL